MILLQLFYEFFKTGLFAIGGGLATLPFLRVMADNTGWFTYEQLADMVAVSESTPGPIGINMATYVGYTTAGIPGSIIASLAVVLPSIIIVLLLARVLRAYSQSGLVQSVFYGLRPASVGLIAAAGYSVLQIALLNIPGYTASGNLLDLFQWKSLLLAAVVYFVMQKWKPHPVVVIALSAVAGAVFGFAGA